MFLDPLYYFSSLLTVLILFVGFFLLVSDKERESEETGLVGGKVGFYEEHQRDHRLVEEDTGTLYRVSESDNFVLQSFYVVL